MFTFSYRTPNRNDWTPKARVWKTKLGALKAGMKWQKDMDAEGCAVQLRFEQIVNGRPVILDL